MLLAILILLANQVLLGQVIAAGQGGGLAPAGAASIRLSDNASQSEIIAAILPQASDTTRPYQWQGQAVTLSAQSPGNGYDMLVEMESTIAL